MLAMIVTQTGDSSVTTINFVTSSIEFAVPSITLIGKITHTPIENKLIPLKIAEKTL